MFNPMIDVTKIMRDIKERVAHTQQADYVPPQQVITPSSTAISDSETDKRLLEYNAEIERIGGFLDDTRQQLEQQADVGIQSPNYRRFPWPLRTVFLLISKSVKKSIKYVIVNQVNFNLSLGKHLKALREQQSMISDKSNVVAQKTTKLQDELARASLEAQENSRGLRAELQNLYAESAGVRAEIEAIHNETAAAHAYADTMRETLENSRQAALDALTQHFAGEIERCEQQISALKQHFAGEIERCEQQISALKQENATLKERRESDLRDMGAMARQIMLAKWKVIDELRREMEKPDDVLTCKICGHAQKRSEYKTVESDCIFNGGHLVRYVCPECGVVFGPSKFIDQGQHGIDEDYWVHYLGFSEGDSSYKEEKAFRQLDPVRGKVYLNYGCGKWSKTLQKLRQEGYDVYGYEPYALEDDNPYLITSKEELEKMRFDGIFSNDVLEHFVDPISELDFMRGLLIDEESRMSHCTACYRYKYEYTRFHTHFFLGNSVKIMAEKAGLRIVSFIDDMDDHDFLCYVYAPKEVERSVLELMIPRRRARRIEEGIRIDCKGLVCGPYLQLPAGKYSIKLNIERHGDDGEPVAAYSLTSDKGVIKLGFGELYDGETNVLHFESDTAIADFECVVEAHKKLTIISEELWKES